MPFTSAKRLLDELKNYGVASQHIHLFSEAPGPEHQEYLDLITARDSASDSPDGVAEAQGAAVLYFIDETRLMTAAQPADEFVNGVRSRLACRGERAYLARVESGRLRVAPVAFEDVRVDWVSYDAGSAAGNTLFSRLVNGTVEWDTAVTRGDDVFDRLRTLLLASADRLAQTTELRPDVLPLLGRVLFFRFLKDREIVTEKAIPEIAPKAKTWKDCFDGPSNTAATCDWLDNTFNGDFLPLTGGGGKSFFPKIDKLTRGDVFTHLTAVILGAEAQGNNWQLTFDWDTFDFAHVPVGLLSQVYEDFCWHWDREEATSTSVHYTPRNIAVTLVDEVFQGLPAAGEARVLDPACGAGVFLVLAFRRLYREIWKTKGSRPNRQMIRRLLNRQLVGFDISENALRLAALSLYLTALELDPKPSPIEELIFDNLRNKVLFNVRTAAGDAASGPVLGSLGSGVGEEHTKAFDVVLSNPPWTSTNAHLGREMQRVTREVLQRAGSPAADSYENPDNNPDLPFLFRSTEWCKPDGRIAMALPARLLLKSERIPASARATLFKLIDVTGIISGVNLAKTNVWPGTDQPFILLFAHNKRPELHPRTRLICPHYDADLNGRGEFRLDADASRPVSTQDAVEEPWLWKAWCVGTSLDVEIVRKLKNTKSAVRVIDYWQALGLAESQQGQGYVEWANGPQNSASFMQGMPDLKAKERGGFIVDPKLLPKFSRATLHAPRTAELYRSPLLLIRQSPGTDRRRGFARLAFRDLVFVSSYYGYSTAGHPDAERLVRYLFLLVHSNIWLHFGLLTGAQFGAERDKLQKQSIDDFPIVPIDELTSRQRDRIMSLSEKLINNDAAVFLDIDKFFGDLYGLSEMDLRVIRDSLEVGQAYRESSGQRACAPPSLAECAAFVKRLQELLAPLLEVESNQLPVTLWFPHDTSMADRTFSAVLLGCFPDALDEQVYFKKVLPLADDTGASQVLMKLDVGGLLIGIRNQYRYWTDTRARLLAAEVARRYLDTLT